MSEAAAIILAAGRGSRMQTTGPKALVPLLGRPIVGHLLDAIQRAGVGRVSVVVGHQADQMRAYLGSSCATPLQAEQLGTAHAVEVARESVQGVKDVLVFVGDSPLIRPESISRLLEVHRANAAACSFLTASFSRHFPYARVIRSDAGAVQAVIEERDCTPEQAKVQEYLTSHFVFDADALWSVLAEIQPHPVTQEQYLTDAIGLLLARGQRVQAVAIDDWRELVGLNTPEDVAWAEGVYSID